MFGYDFKDTIDVGSLEALLLRHLDRVQPYLRLTSMTRRVDMRRLLHVGSKEMKSDAVFAKDRRHALGTQPSEQRRHVERAEAVMVHPADVGVEEVAQVGHAVFQGAQTVDAEAEGIDPRAALARTLADTRMDYGLAVSALLSRRSWDVSAETSRADI